MEMKGLFLGLILAGMTASAGFAQDTTTKPKAEVRSITGCLSKGDSANEYLLLRYGRLSTNDRPLRNITRRTSGLE